MGDWHCWLAFVVKGSFATPSCQLLQHFASVPPFIRLAAFVTAATWVLLTEIQWL